MRGVVAWTAAATVLFGSHGMERNRPAQDVQETMRHADRVWQNRPNAANVGGERQ